MSSAFLPDYYWVVHRQPVSDYNENGYDQDRYAEELRRVQYGGGPAAELLLGNQDTPRSTLSRSRCEAQCASSQIDSRKSTMERRRLNSNTCATLSKVSEEVRFRRYAPTHKGLFPNYPKLTGLSSHRTTRLSTFKPVNESATSEPLG
ncbi:hypothetical protein AHF37_01826 [Paragonimus kellicotti]|nr:hypothetical protein AHF37_01826 [Paragonimus kellicotti]